MSTWTITFIKTDKKYLARTHLGIWSSVELYRRGMASVYRCLRRSIKPQPLTRIRQTVAALNQKSLFLLN